MDRTELYTDAQLRSAGIVPEEHAQSVAEVAAATERFGGFVDLATLKEWGFQLATALEILYIPEHGAPAFQFANRKVKPIVATINLFLEAADDPYGVADWWLLPNSYLAGEVPVTLLGRDDTALRELAWAEVPD